MVKEMKSLIKKLDAENIPYDLVENSLFGCPQVFVPSAREKNYVIDFISHEYTYGGSEGLLEAYGPKLGDAIGWLNSEKAFELAKKVYKGK